MSETRAQPVLGGQAGGKVAAPPGGVCAAPATNGGRGKSRGKGDRLEAERSEKERLEAELVETQRVKAGHLEAQRSKVQRLETKCLEAERKEAERKASAWWPSV